MSIESRMRRRVHYGWIVVAVTLVTLLAAAGIRSAPGVLINPLEREFGWTRATVSFATPDDGVRDAHSLVGPLGCQRMRRRIHENRAPMTEVRGFGALASSLVRGPTPRPALNGSPCAKCCARAWSRAGSRRFAPSRSRSLMRET